MKRLSRVVAIVAALAVALPATAGARLITVINNTHEWVHFSGYFPPVPPLTPPPVSHLASGKAEMVPIPAIRIYMIHIILLREHSSGQEWSQFKQTNGQAVTVRVRDSGMTLEQNGANMVHIVNLTKSWAVITIELLPPWSPPPASAPRETSWCVNPGETLTTTNLPDDGNGHVVVFAHAACNGPRIFDHNADGSHIRVSGKPGSYTVEAHP